MGGPTAIVIGREMRMTTISIADELSGTMPLKRDLGGYLHNIHIICTVVIILVQVR